LKRKDCGKKEEIRDSSSINTYKMESMLEKKRKKKQISPRMWQKSKYLGISLVDQNVICNEIKRKFNGEFMLCSSSEISSCLIYRLNI
jgi:hypothetical protein